MAENKESEKKPGPKPESFSVDPKDLDKALDNLVADRPKPKK